MALSEAKEQAIYMREKLGQLKKVAEAAKKKQDAKFYESIEKEISELMERLKEYSEGRIAAWER